MEIKTEIQTCLQVFSGKDFRTAAIGLLNTLGYQSEKILDLDGSPDAFLEQFDNDPDRADYTGTLATDEKYRDIR